MKKLRHSVALIFLLSFRFFVSNAQDVPVLQMAVGAASNVSLFSNGINNAGGYFSLDYFISRNIFVGVQADYLVGQNNIQFNNPSFGNGVTFPGDTLKIKEQITKINAGLYAGYKFFPLSDVSINLSAGLSNISLDRKFKNNSVLKNDAVNWYADNWASNSAMAFGLAASFDFYLSKVTMLRAGVNYQDVTNELFNARDHNMVKEISYTDGKISTMNLHSKPFQAIDMYVALVFKLGLKKL